MISIVLPGDHERCLDHTAELSLEHPQTANICPLLKAIIIVRLIC